MAREQEAFNKALEKIVEVVMFENWMRFYFITEKPGGSEKESGEPALVMTIPEQGMGKIEELYPELAPLARDMNGKDVDFSVSQQSICAFMAHHIEGQTISSELSNMVLNSDSLNVELQLFNAWVQGHEDQLDKQFLDFGTWRGLYAQWRNSDQVREMATQLRTATLQAVTNPPKTTVQ